MTIEIVDFPIKNGGFSIAMLNYQRVEEIFPVAVWSLSHAQPTQRQGEGSRMLQQGTSEESWAGGVGQPLIL